jgi:hypothetical protein
MRIIWDLDNNPFCPKTDFRQNSGFFINPGIESMLLVSKSNAMPNELHHILL